ncbi:cytochrome c [bacterium]|nr:MAG: cytochrome c [bacterium]
MRWQISLLGCAGLGMIGWVAKPAEPGKVEVPKKPTYAAHVAPILNAKCVACHRPGEVAPFSLIGYDNAKKWAKMAAVVTESKQMPPWKAVPGYGEHLDANILSPEEIAILAAWSKTGATAGDLKKAPLPPSFSSDWSLGDPDLVIQPTQEFKLEAEGEDVYRNFVIRNESKETRWVEAMDVKPGNKKVVHHVIVWLDGMNKAPALEAAQQDGQEGYISSGGGAGFLPTGSLGGWAPGLRARRGASGTAFKLAPGANMVVQVHYHKSGKPETDRTRVGLYFAKEKPEREMKLAWIANFMLDLPAGKVTQTRAVQKFPVAATVYSVMPHMHLLGRKMKAWMEFPDGTTKPLVQVEDWDFNWQFNYALKEPIQAPAGSKLIVEGEFDNSADNVRNPSSPPRRVRWGEETTDEMFLLVTSYTLAQP